MKRILWACVAVLAAGGWVLADEGAAEKRLPADNRVEAPATPEAGKPAPDPAEKANAPIENREWRGVMHSAGQVREAAVVVMIGFGTIFSILTLGAMLIFTAGIAPNAVARASVAVRDHSLRSFFVGAVALFLGTGVTVATKGVAGIFLLPIFTAALLIGLAGVSEQIGRNLWHLGGREGNRVGHLAAGWTVFSFVSIFPFIGWFGFLPYYAAVGVGSFFSTMSGRGAPRTPQVID